MRWQTRKILTFPLFTQYYLSSCMLEMSTKALFAPLQVGSITLKNRFFMSALTRNRAPNTYPSEIMKEYYVQRMLRTQAHIPRFIKHRMATCSWNLGWKACLWLEEYYRRSPQRWRKDLRSGKLILYYIKLFIESDKILLLCSCGIISKTCRKDLLYVFDHLMSIVGWVSHPDAPEQILAGVVSLKFSRLFQCWWLHLCSPFTHHLRSVPGAVNSAISLVSLDMSQ